MLNVIKKKFPVTELQGKIACSENSSWDSFHESNISNPNRPSHIISTNTFVLSPNQYVAAQSVVTRIYAGRYGFQILARGRERSLLQKIQTSSSAHTASNSMKTRAFFWQ